MSETNYTPAQLEAWAGLGPWRISSTAQPPLIYSDKGQGGTGLWIASIYADSPGERDHHKTNAALIAAAPDLARLVLEKDKEIARLRKFLSELKADCEAAYPPSHGAIKYAIRQAMKETSDE